MYREVPARIEDVAAMEADVAEFWRDHDIFHRSLEQRADGPRWVFYEGPPTANGSPGTHHIEARAFKDVFPRHRTMKGYLVPRQAGWDCHGLPVELAVEKELGFSGKQDIEAFGIAEFNEKCRESVLRHVGQFTELTERMGYWVDMESAYWTMAPQYVESVWWSLKRIFDAGLLVQDHRVSPYCPRCGTGLSDHELAQGYEDVVDPSVYVRFPVTGGALAERFPGLELLVWTTTPWTLVSNVAVAAQPTATYVVARTEAGTFLVAADLAEPLFGADGYEVAAELTGADLEHTPYAAPFDLVAVPDAHFVIRGDYVTTDDGTGLVHIAPAFGADDLAAARGYDLPLVNPVAADGTFAADVPLVGGMFFKKADQPLIADLDLRGLLFRHEPYEHAYPHCWRCHTPLIYYAQPSWFIRTTARKDDLLAQNEDTNWFPPTTQWGRYGDWLRNNIDWALSRDRYWGTPLPLWRCPADHVTAVGSLAELSELAGTDVTALDPHRPFVDDITLPCPQCGEQARRVPEVIDCWYDSGAMPFAQFGYPHAGVAEFERSYPADFICEAIDQTRGWFYTLMAVGTLVFDRSSYRNVLCLGHILDADGRKMSKHLGNVLDPIALMDAHGADSVRWFMLASGSPWQARRVGDQAIAEVWRKTLATYWSTVAFQALYARAAQWSPAADAPASDHVLDRWARSRAHRMTRTVDEHLERFDSQAAGRELAAFIDDLSNWYVRRSRRRFWDGDAGALTTLHECLQLLTQAMAPFTPFITERVWQDLFEPAGAGPSVHLTDWPEPDPAALDDTLEDQMALVRRLVDLGRTARGEAALPTRQPLAAALVAAPGWDALPADLRSEVAAELNCQALEALADAAGDLVDTEVKPNFRALGRRFGKQTPAVAAAVSALDPAGLAAQLRAPDPGASVHVDGMAEPVQLGPDDVVITETPREGWAVASADGATVALDLHLTDDLVRLGIARQAVRVVQDARKASGFDVSDRISLWWAADDPDTAAALAEHEALIAGEVLATGVTRGAGPGPSFADREDTFRVWVERSA